MGAAVTVLASVVPFWESVLLVLISATATGLFGILIVYVQARSEAQIHYRLEKLEEKGTSIENKADRIVEKTDTIQSVVTSSEEK